MNGIYISVYISLDDNDCFTIKENRKIFFTHCKLSEIRGTFGKTLFLFFRANKDF